MSKSRQFTDKQLLKGLREHDTKVLRFIYREYRSIIRLLVYNKGGSTVDTKDIFLDGMIELMQMKEKPGFKLRSSMKTMIYAICRNQWSKRVRRLPREVPLVLSEHETPADAEFPGHMDIHLYERLFWTTFKDLPETCRKVLLLHWKNYNYKEISKLLNISESYVRKRKSLCTNRFVDMVKKHKEYDLLTKSTTEIEAEKKAK